MATHSGSQDRYLTETQTTGEVPAWAHYRKASNSQRECSTCIYFFGGECAMFNAHVQGNMVCDEWEGHVHKEEPLYTAAPAHRVLEGLDLLRMSQLVESLEPVGKASVSAAGLAVRAKDTGRVLMIQRAHDPKDKAAGTWEFPGGLLEAGEHPYTGAKREWQEEMGQRLPRGQHVGETRHNNYQLFIHEIPREGSVKANLDHEDRRIRNPDDPDGDAVEVAAWFHPLQLRRMSSLRPELRESKPWAKVAKADTGTLYLISHAKTRYNQPGQPDSDKVQGWKDTPLDATGREQAKQLGQILKGYGIEQLYSSDLKRAQQTADIISRVAGIPVKVSSDYKPWNLGNLAGHSSASVRPQLKTYMNERSHDVVGGGESFDDFKERFIPALEGLLEDVGKGQVVGLVTHSRNIELAQGWLGGRGQRQKVDTKAISDDKVDPATIFQVSKQNGRWRIKEIESLTKDGAAGPAGDLPASQDQGQQFGMPSDNTLAAVGPTLEDVHVNRPLRNISVSYVGGKKKKLQVVKADNQRQLIYGVVLEPNVVDSQDDFMFPDQVESAAHNYMKKVARGKATVSKLQHSTAGFFKSKPSVVPVESFVAPTDFSYDGKEMVKKGTWVMVLHVEDPGIWRDVLDGKYTGLSIGGSGIRRSANVPSDVIPHQWMMSEPSWAKDQGVMPT